MLLRELDRRKSRKKLSTYYPETGPLRRELYKQQMEFFRLGSVVPTRCFLAGNRTGKTEAGGYEMTCHLTGVYPTWWEGRRFNTPIDAWCAGDNKETVRDILQFKLLGPEGAFGTGLIPGDHLLNTVKRPNGNGALDYILVRHVPTGKVSRLGFKSYDQGREAFQGTEKHVIWLDEESNEQVRGECSMRLMTTGGLLIETFTPLKGLTPIVLKYLGEGGAVPKDRVAVSEHRAIVFAGWDDVPHLTDEMKAKEMAECAVHLRAARSKGIPSLGSGAIYPVPEEDITVDDFEIPAHWPKAYGLDVGWNKTAAVFAAIDRDADVVYLYSEHYMGEAEPSTHVAAIRARGAMLPGVIDPASRGRSQKDGEQLLQNYTDLGLNLIPADNSRESGLFNVHQRLASGRLKVFRSMVNFFMEYRIYRRDEKGHVVKEKDHLMDACLTADTMVWTDKGRIRIDALVGQEGVVYSRAGAMCRFLGARLTMANASVVTVWFEDGSEVTCTPDHPFLTPIGWVRADEMTGQMAYNGVSQSIHCSPWTRPSFQQRARSFLALATTCAASISSAAASAFTGLFGRTPTAVPSRTDSMSITRMGSEQTIPPEISIFWPDPITFSTINSATSVASPNKPWKPQRPGMPPMMAAPGTSSTTPSTPTNCTSGSRCGAISAASGSSASSTAATGSAPTTASRRTVERLVLTTKNALAWYAAAASWRIATLGNQRARASVLDRCVAVQNAGRADVYCLTVPATSSFCVAGGVVVHNTRYLAVSGLDVATVAMSGTSIEYRNKRKRKGTR